MSAWSRWVEQAQYDLVTARAMLDSGRYLYVLFCCQQAAEKMLKGLIAERTSDLPPRIHQLVRLAEVAHLELPEERLELLLELSTYYIQSRYPEELPSFGAKVTKPYAYEVLRRTEEIVQWLRSSL